MNINQEIEKEEMKVQSLVKDWHSQKLVSFIDDLIKQDRAEQLNLSGVVKPLPSKDAVTTYLKHYANIEMKEFKPDELICFTSGVLTLLRWLKEDEIK